MTQQLENEALPPTPPLPATDPWINESLHQAGDSMNWGLVEDFKVQLHPAWSEAILPASWLYCSSPLPWT